MINPKEVISDEEEINSHNNRTDNKVENMLEPRPVSGVQMTKKMGLIGSRTKANAYRYRDIPEEKVNGIPDYSEEVPLPPRPNGPQPDPPR